MARGENAEKRGHAGREYWSPRHPGMLRWGRVGKWLTHRLERVRQKRETRRELERARNEGDADAV